MGYDPLSSELWSARAVVVRPGGFIDKAAYGCEFSPRGGGESLGARASRPRRWKKLPLLMSGRDARSPKL